MHGTEAKLDDRKDQRNWLQKGGKNMKKNNKNSVQRVSCRVPLERSRPFTDPGAPFHAGDVWRPFSKPRKRTQKTTPAAGYGHRTRWMNHRSSSLRWPVSAGLSGFFLSPPTAASRRPPPRPRAVHSTLHVSAATSCSFGGAVIELGRRIQLPLTLSMSGDDDDDDADAEHRRWYVGKAATRCRRFRFR